MSNGKGWLYVSLLCMFGGVTVPFQRCACVCTNSLIPSGLESNCVLFVANFEFLDVWMNWWLSIWVAWKWLLELEALESGFWEGMARGRPRRDEWLGPDQISVEAQSGSQVPSIPHHPTRCSLRQLLRQQIHNICITVATSMTLGSIKALWHRLGLSSTPITFDDSRNFQSNSQLLVMCQALSDLERWEILSD